MLHRLYRAIKQIPILGPPVNGVLRLGRRVFWSLRPAAKADSPLPEAYLAFLKAHLDAGPFVLVEVGAGDGRILRELARRYPTSRFVGVDIQKAAVAGGKRLLAKEGITNVDLVCSSCLEDAIDWNCDYIVSRTALIYLNRSEIEMFLDKRLPQVQRAVLLQEITSTTGKTEVSHFFANPLAELARHIGGEAFSVSTHILDYGPWRQTGRWSGAEIVIRRVT